MVPLAIMEDMLLFFVRVYYFRHGSVQKLRRSFCLFSRLHGFFSAQFTTPLVKSGAKSPQPSNDSIPSIDFIDKIEIKYGKKINGDFDSARLNDPVCIASLLPDIVKKHKSVLGKNLFNELHEYLGTGKSFYCRRCHWKVSNRESFYRHILNPYHVNMTYRRRDGRQFNLLTLSINVHMRDEN